MMLTELNRKMKNLKMKLAAVLLMSVSILQFQSCKTLKENTVAIPIIENPKFPINVTDKNIDISVSDTGIVRILWKDINEEVLMPIWVWEDFVRYAIDVDSTIEQYKIIVERLNVQY